MAAQELTANRLEVLRLIAAGRTYREAARDLGIKPPAVANRMQQVVRQLGASTVPHAVLLACQAGILDGRPFLRHGDHAGYEQHVRRRIPICDACREGERAYRAGQREAKVA